jgi:uncharacterized protein (DUF305 family)
MRHVHRVAALVAGLAVGACAARGGTGAVGGEPEAPTAHASTPAHDHGPSHDHAAMHGAAMQGHDHAAMHGQGHGASHGSMLPATAGRGYTVADVQFMQHMIAHHAQAVVMAGMAKTHGAGREVQQLAEKIDISQRDEIEFMERWLAERGQAVPTEEHLREMHMPGMLTPEQMAQLDAARGSEFDRLFLTFMIEHHRGALEMVKDLFADPNAGQDPELFQFVTDVDVDQRAEIHIMRSMLAMLATSGRSEF